MEAGQTEDARFIVKTKMTEELYQYGSKGFRAYSARNGGWRIWAVILIGLAVTGFGAYISEGTMKKIYIFLFGLFLLAFIPLSIMWLTRRLAIKIAYKNIVKKMEGNLDQTYTFTDDCMKVDIWYREESMKYSFLVFLLEMPEMFMIFARNNTIYYFKKDQLEGGTPEEFRKFIEEKAELKAQYAEVKG